MRTIAVLMLMAAVSCDIPKDPEDTLRSIRSEGKIVVGAVDAPPWLKRQGRDASGIEADLVREIAGRNGAEIDWLFRSQDELLAALEHYEIDLVVGNISADSPWKTKVTMTGPFYEESWSVGFREAPLTDSVPQGTRVAVSEGTPAAHWARKADLEPVPSPDPFSLDLPVVAPDWKLRKMGYTIIESPKIKKVKHVWAVPPGENAWLMEVERVLLEAGPIVDQTLEGRQ